MGLSIIVTSYNSSKFIDAFFESLVFVPVDYEIIVVDDCSTDNSREILAAKLIGYDFTLILNEKNLGTVRSLNKAIKVASGSLIKCVSIDDEIAHGFKDYVEEILSIRNFSESIFYGPIEIAGSYRYSKFFGYRKLLLENTLLAPSITIGRTLFDELGGFSEDYVLMEDYPFWLKAAKRNHPFVEVGIAPVKYRIHEGQTSSPGIKCSPYWRDYFKFTLKKRYAMLFISPLLGVKVVLQYLKFTLLCRC
jgi:glycosyltransferase involved in cell wall biosynthesis